MMVAEQPVYLLEDCDGDVDRLEVDELVEEVPRAEEDGGVDGRAPQHQVLVLQRPEHGLTWKGRKVYWVTRVIAD